MFTFGCIRWYCALYHGVCKCDKEFITTGGSTKHASGIILMLCVCEGSWAVTGVTIWGAAGADHHLSHTPRTQTCPAWSHFHPLQGNPSITPNTRNKWFSLINKQPWHGARAPAAPVPAGRSTAEQLLWQVWDSKGQVITSPSEA